jgi:hypothetical protein
MVLTKRNGDFMKAKILSAILILTIMMVPLGMLQAQLKSQIPTSVSVEDHLRVPGIGSTSLGLNLFSADRFSMHHSYSLSLMSVGKSSASVGIYQNHMSYLISDKMMLNARVGIVHDPLKLGNQQLNFNLKENLFYGADLIYRPNDKMLLNISFDKVPPMYRYNYYPYYSRYSYPYFPY